MIFTNLLSIKGLLLCKFKMIFNNSRDNLKQYKMGEIINNFLLAGDNFIPGIHLKQPKFIYSVCYHSQKRTGELSHIYQNKLDRTCFQWIWLMVVLKIFQVEKLPIKYYLIR